MCGSGLTRDPAWPVPSAAKELNHPGTLDHSSLCSPHVHSMLRVHTSIKQTTTNTTRTNVISPCPFMWWTTKRMTRTEEDLKARGSTSVTHRDENWTPQRRGQRYSFPGWWLLKRLQEHVVKIDNQHSWVQTLHLLSDWSWYTMRGTDDSKNTLLYRSYHLQNKASILSLDGIWLCLGIFVIGDDVWRFREISICKVAFITEHVS